MHLYSDASPATGVELQGMILDIMYIDDTLDPFVLPGVCLAHGAFWFILQGLRALMGFIFDHRTMGARPQFRFGLYPKHHDRHGWGNQIT